jgi:integrase
MPRLGDIRLDQLSPTHIEAAWVKMGEKGARRDGRGHGGLHPRTILHAHRCLPTALESAAKQGLLSRNPATLAEVPRQVRSEVRALDEAQLRRVLVAAREYRDGLLYVPILLAATCALRRGEVCALRWADANFEEATLAVRRSLETTTANSFHRLRYSAATLILARGAGVKVVQDTLGHSTPTLTLGTYGHVLKAHQQEAARLVDEVLGLSDEDQAQSV